MENIYDLCIAWDWEYDKDFINLLKENASIKGFTTYVVDNKNLDSTINQLEKNELIFKFFFDRASDTSPEFVKLHRLVQKLKIPVFETLEELNWATDKATMHLELISNGINTPYSIIIPPYKETEKIFISVSDLAKLGRPFIIKPANTTGGGIGVVQGAETLQDILLARKEFQADKYLLQEHIIPLHKDEKTFWFRGFNSCGLSQCTWWDPDTHIYNFLSEEEINHYNLSNIFSIIKNISKICKLRFFSTEIVLNTAEKFVVVDYVNISSDMRIKSKHYDGVPDEIVYNIVESIIEYTKNIIYS